MKLVMKQGSSWPWDAIICIALNQGQGEKDDHPDQVSLDSLFPSSEGDIQNK